MSKVNDLLSQLDDAFDHVEQLTKTLADVRQQAHEAVSAQQQKLDTVKADYDGKIATAQKATDDARVALDKLRQQVNERVGSLTGLGTDPRVTVR